jgi:uncharacterized protein
VKAVFADTSFYVALANRRDELHARALSISNRRQPVVTTESVLTEFGNFLSAIGWRHLFVGAIPVLWADPMTRIVSIDGSLFERGCDLYARRPDKQWSMTDCLSFVVMEDEGLREALTADHHFVQAGFTALLE